jgi:hypothetical protein
MQRRQQRQQQQPIGVTQYAYLLSLTSPRSSRTTPRQHPDYSYYEPRLRSNTTFAYHPFESDVAHSTTGIDTNESLSVFDRIQSMDHRQLRPMPLVSTNTLPTSNRLTDARTLRERLLADIQETIGEIDRDLSIFLPSSPVVHRVTPRRPLFNNRTSSHVFQQGTTHIQQQSWPDKPRRAYQVVPNLINESTKISRSSSHDVKHNSTLKFVDQSQSHAFLGQYHYAPEVDEIEVHPNDAENVQYDSIMSEPFQPDTFKIESTANYLRQVSNLSEHHAILFVPQFGDNRHLTMNECVDEFMPNEPNDAHTVRPLIASPLDGFPSIEKINIENLSLLIRTASEQPIVSKSIAVEQANTIEIPSKTDERIHSTTVKTQPQATRTEIPLIALERKEHDHSTTTKTLSPSTRIEALESSGYFFSDFNNDIDNGDKSMYIDPKQFLLSDRSDGFRRKFEFLLHLNIYM